MAAASTPKAAAAGAGRPDSGRGHDSRRGDGASPSPAGTGTAGPRRSDRAPLSREEITANLLIDEQRLVAGLVERAVYSAEERRRIADMARRLVHASRANQHKHSGVDAFMREYGLSNDEGLILLGLAESLLRIPDPDTADRLIAEKIAGGRWDKHIGASDSLLVNASTWGLLLTGKLVKLGSAQGAGPFDALKRLVARSGEPVVRQAVRQAVKLLGDQFVLGRTIKEALARSAPLAAKGTRFSYDMLGEAARSDADAQRYLARYLEAVEAIGAAHPASADIHADALMARPGLSIKLSALHPRFEPGRPERLAAELLPRLLQVLEAARARAIPVTIDAEEQERLEPTLDMMEAAFLDARLAGWEGLGLAVQAYGRRAVPVLRWLRRLSERGGKRIPVRLVKGAYWDSEIKWAQERGLADYPVLTRKINTDVSYLACMRLLLSDRQAFYPQFATHNAHTLASASVAAGNAAYELQRLHGMGEALYEDAIGDAKIAHAARIYAPVGGHEDLLAYLVRRMIENGANTSFVHRLADDETPVAELVRDPVASVEAELEQGQPMPSALLPRPRRILSDGREAAAGSPLFDSAARSALLGEVSAALAEPFAVGPLVGGALTAGGDGAVLLTCPHDRRQRLGSVVTATPEQVAAALETAGAAVHAWDRLGGAARARIFAHAAGLLERDRARLMAVLIREAGKTLDAAQAEVREAIDYLRYYGLEARRLFGGPVLLNGPTGERNTLELRARGVIACISPWNFPLAIFLGQVVGALAAGNAVVAKPAEQTPISAFLAVRLLHEAGVPPAVLNLLPGGGMVGAALTKDARVAGIAFTGSNDTAWTIQRALTDRRGAIIPFIAETGGVNAMIADSSALPEQVVRDAVRSAFDSAGQRCSAARVLFLQDDVAPRMIEMLTGAIAALEVGDPMSPSTDIGPVIDERAQDALDGHKVRMQHEARELIDVRMPPACRAGTYVTPAAYETDRLEVLEREVFGPILHVVRYQRGHLDRVVAALNRAGFGLTLGLHSRIAAVADYVAEHARVGSLYVNRNQIGAQVGVQPLGGEGLSGTGPKAGGPHYVARFATERVRTDDVTATGGNAELLWQASGDDA